jgi:uncharacterized protein YacL
MNKNFKTILAVGLTAVLVACGSNKKVVEQQPAEGSEAEPQVARESIDPQRRANRNVAFDQYFNEIKPDAAPAKPDDKGQDLQEEVVVDAASMPAELAAFNKLLDTSVIIDGRIADILKTGFLEGNLVIPHFVLDELQRLSDSSDNLKRAKGRRGLDFIHELQEMFHHVVIVQDPEHDMIQDVDSKLVALAKDTNSIIVTNDFNLNKVASIQGIRVLNINDLANAVKPVVIPGEEMTAYLLREGKESGQAIAYLQDGTMIVVEGGRKYIGNKIRIAVTSVLQTSAGRMIFAKVPKNHDVRDMLAGAEGK